MSRAVRIILLFPLLLSLCQVSFGKEIIPFMTIERSSSMHPDLFASDSTLIQIELYEQPPELILIYSGDVADTNSITYDLFRFLAHRGRSGSLFLPEPHCSIRVTDSYGVAFNLKSLRWQGRVMEGTTLQSNRTVQFAISGIRAIGEIDQNDIAEGQYRLFDDSGFGALMPTAAAPARPWQFGLNLTSIWTLPFPGISMTFPNRTALHATAIPHYFSEPVYFGTLKSTLFESPTHTFGMGVYADLIEGHGHASGQFEPEWFQLTDERNNHFRAAPFLIYTLGSNTSITVAAGASAGGDFTVFWTSLQKRTSASTKIVLDFMAIQDTMIGSVAYRYIWPKDTIDLMLFYGFIPSIRWTHTFQAF
ncbi:hypothetical protein KQI63_13725 [bacterium]|nr:hypothetical protein [bacterium]